jgi:hypothetical protein
MTCQIKHGYTIITDSGENMITLSTGTLRCYELEKVFRISADLGFDGVELIVDERRHTRDPAYLRKLSGRYRASTRRSALSGLRTGERIPWSG